MPFPYMHYGCILLLDGDSRHEIDVAHISTAQIPEEETHTPKARPCSLQHQGRRAWRPWSWRPGRTQTPAGGSKWRHWRQCTRPLGSSMTRGTSNSTWDGPSVWDGGTCSLHTQASDPTHTLKCSLNVGRNRRAHFSNAICTIYFCSNLML